MPNALAGESSPYLLQHAENPVEWYPWGDEAIALARELDRPILLSIGYASCHWCHVMAHESFEDAETASYMNDHFVSIKVDREERPDIDAIYMEAAQAMTGHGGWPLTAFLTPQQVPFFAGTYFPPEPRPNMPSFRQLMMSIEEAWRTQREDIEASGEVMVNSLSRTARLKAPPDPVDASALTEAGTGLIGAYDERFGGFGGAPKFPAASVIDFLLAGHDERRREIALDTLRKMAAGGIYDQLGGGFARYSVDERWSIPHFEKMLYDNALLARNYLHAWQLTGDDEFARVVRETLDWMLTEMRGDEGGFASALDADSIDSDGHLEEGAFYAWDIDELREVIGASAPGHVGDFFAYWGVIDHGEFEGKNVLFVNAPERKPPEPEFAEVRTALYRRRADRHWPGRDDKRIASWNALAIAALAEAGAVLGEARYREAAIACAEFAERELKTDGGWLLRSTLDGRPGPPGYLEDHAYMAGALLTLYEATFDERWFVRARELADIAIARFADPEGGFFSVADDHEQLIVRRKDIEDSPIPSSNAAIALVLLRLSAFTGDAEYRRLAGETLQMIQKVAARFPTGFGHALQAIDFYLGPVKELALIGDDVSALTATARKTFRPKVVLAGGAAGADTRVPLLADRPTVDGKPSAYVCESFACQRPVTEPAELERLLD
ncbi:MAG: thioredoxin domain-containing protein [Solirubrobacterales bacterium]